MILVIKLNKVKNFCPEIVRFLYSICIWKCIPTIGYEERAFDHLLFQEKSSKCSKNLTSVNIKKEIFLKDVQISKYHFLWFQILIYRSFFQ